MQRPPEITADMGGPSPPDRGVQHQSLHAIQPDMGGLQSNRAAPRSGHFDPGSGRELAFTWRTGVSGELEWSIVGLLEGGHYDHGGESA